MTYPPAWREAVARALVVNIDAGRADTWDVLLECHREMYRSDADAAIRALVPLVGAVFADVPCCDRCCETIRALTKESSDDLS